MRWLRHPLGWITPDRTFVYRGDFRLHLHTVHRQNAGLGKRRSGGHYNLYRYEVIFKKATVHGVGCHPWLVVAMLISVVDTYRLFWRLGMERA